MSDSKNTEIAARIQNTLTARVNALTAKGDHNAARNVAKYARTLVACADIVARHRWDIERLGVVEKTSPGYVAVYTLDKIADIAHTLKTGVSAADGNVRAVFLNALSEGVLTNAECNVSVSSVTAIEGARVMPVRHRVSANTAGTQASYARSAMDYCGIGSKANRAFALNPKNSAYKALRAILAPEPVNAEVSA